MKKIFGYYSSSMPYPNDARRVDVYEDNGTCYAICYTDGKDAQEVRVDLTENVLAQIKTLYSDNPRIFDIEDVDFPPILDGNHCRFEFIDESNENNIHCCNAWYFLDNPCSEDTELLINVYLEIAQILNDAGVDEKYLKL